MSCIICLTVAPPKNNNIDLSYSELDLPGNLSSYANRIMGIKNKSKGSKQSKQFELFEYSKPHFGETKTKMLTRRYGGSLGMGG